MNEVPGPWLVSVWAVLGVLPVERVPLWAAHWLADGNDGPALGELAGLHGDSFETQQVRELLPAAFAECGVTPPGPEVADALQVFSHLAAVYRDGKAAPRWVAQKVDEYLDGGRAPAEVLALPLGRLHGLDEEHGDAELIALTDDACRAQLHLFTAV